MRNVSMKVRSDWRSRSGQGLEGETVRLRMVGNPAGPRVLVLGGISAGRCVTSLDDGWWSGLAGPGRVIDTDRFLVIGADYPPSGRCEAKDLCPEDFARLIREALDEAGVQHLEAVVGSSFGGMVGLAFARLYPETVSTLVVLCAGHRPHPMATALRHVQRQILDLTEGTNREADGVALARQLAMTTYRTAEEFGARFADQGELRSYLHHHGTKYAGGVTAARYRTLSLAIDNHREDPRTIRVPTLVIAAESDRVVPLSIVQEMAAGLPKLLGYEVLRSAFGHDAFLKETATIAPLLRRVLG
ncbi:homoserine O-acetyltransferase [Parvularcula lutaonensis]|nr:homoserine O-acetyltransferase [Parvularcula lutaonensis]